MYNSQNQQVKKDKRSKVTHLVSIFFFLIFFFYSLPSYSQCAMCRAALESQSNTIQAESVNDGIVYLMVIPYLLVALAGYAVYKIKFAKKKEA